MIGRGRVSKGVLAAVSLVLLSLAAGSDTGYSYFVSAMTPNLTIADKYAGALVWYTSDPSEAQVMRSDTRYFQGSLGAAPGVLGTGYSRWRLNWQGEWFWHVPTGSWQFGEQDELNRPGPWRTNGYYDNWYESGPIYAPEYRQSSDVITVFQFEDFQNGRNETHCYEMHHRQVWFNPGDGYTSWSPWGTSRYGAGGGPRMGQVNCNSGP